MSQHVLYRTAQVDGLAMFYREVGPKDAPTMLLLHGLPSSSRMFAPLFARLADRYHLVAPDYPGFGHSDWPDPKQFQLHLRPHRFRDGRLHASDGFVAVHDSVRREMRKQTVGISVAMPKLPTIISTDSKAKT